MSASQKQSQGWEQPEGSAEWHYFDKGVSLCRHWMGYWPRPHSLDDPNNCQQCTQYVRAGNTTLENPFRP